MKQRPTGVTILAGIYLLLAVVSILWGLLIFGVGVLNWVAGVVWTAIPTLDVFTFSGEPGWMAGFRAEDLLAFGGGNTWAGLIGFVSAIVQAIVAFGLLALQRWAWLLAILGVLLTVVQGVIGMSGGGFYVFGCGLFGLVIPGGILLYLLQPRVRAAFNHRPRGYPQKGQV